MHAWQPRSVKGNALEIIGRAAANNFAMLARRPELATFFRLSVVISEKASGRGIGAFPAGTRVRKIRAGGVA